MHLLARERRIQRPPPGSALKRGRGDSGGFVQPDDQMDVLHAVEFGAQIEGAGPPLELHLERDFVGKLEREGGQVVYLEWVACRGDFVCKESNYE